MLLPSELETQARAKADECMERAEKYFTRSFPALTCRFDLRGLTAGAALGWTIRINMDLLIKYPDEQLHNTIPHEIAHCLAYAIHAPSIAPHGREWQGIMRDVFHLSPTVCHRMKATPARKVARQKAYCGCPEGHQVTNTLAKRIQQGRRYTCRKCRQRIYLTLPSFDNLLADIK